MLTAVGKNRWTYGEYKISNRGGTLVCSCKSWKYRRYCKHTRGLYIFVPHTTAARRLGKLMRGYARVVGDRIIVVVDSMHLVDKYLDHVVSAAQAHVVGEYKGIGVEVVLAGERYCSVVKWTKPDLWRVMLDRASALGWTLTSWGLCRGRGYENITSVAKLKNMLGVP